MPRRNAPCCCHSGKKYKHCCEPWHRGQRPPTAAALMRSRYAAYALGLTDYVMATTHPDGPHWETDQVAWAEGIRAFGAGTSFDGLHLDEDDQRDDEAWVTFTATLQQGGQDASFTERSHFLRVDRRWLYHAGERRD